MKKLMILVVTLISNSALASGEDLVNCRWKDGREIDPRDCATFRRVAAEDQANEDAYQKRYAEMQESNRKRDEERAAEKAKQQAIIEVGNKKRVAEIARQDAESKRYRDNEERKERAAEKSAAAREQAVKDKCGADYRTPKIGMALARAQQCVGKFTLKSQINRADGVISTYTNGYTYINVMDDRIVSWQKF